MDATNAAGRVLDKLVEEFSNDITIPRYMAHAMIQVPGVPSEKWSLNNQIVQAIFGTADARGYRQWQSVGRHVRKGAKAIHILIPKTVMVETDEKDGDGKPITKPRLVGFGAAPVFRVEDTDGKPLPRYEPPNPPPLLGLAKHNGIHVEYRNSTHGEEGSFSPTTKELSLSVEAPDVFLHELMHVYDGKTHELKGGQDPTRECVAQLGACVLAEMYELPGRHKANTAAYVAAYAGAKTPDQLGSICLKVAERTMTAIRLILADAQKLKVQTPEITA